MRVKDKSEKVGLKLNIQRAKIMVSGPITSWQIDGEKVEAVTDFIFLGSKITVDGDRNHDIKRHLPFGRKAMTNVRKSKGKMQKFWRWIHNNVNITNATEQCI